MKVLYALALAFFSAANGSASTPPEQGQSLAEVCDHLGVPSGCEIIREAASMLGPTYDGNKAIEALRRLRELHYVAAYHPADTTLHRPTVDFFFARREGSNRLYIIITGTEEPLDWASNARFANYTSRFRSGAFYIPPGHGGFRGAVIDIIRENLLRADEFANGLPQCSPEPTRASALTRFICDSGGWPNGQLETIIVGHSRGVGIGMMAATVVAGRRVSMPQNGPAAVVGAPNWPLRLHAIIGFAPPQAISSMTDIAARAGVPDGLPDHEQVLNDLQIPTRTIMFINERDIVPLLGLGRARHYGHLFRIRRDRRVVYEGNRWGPDGGVGEAHSSALYCADVFREFGERDPVAAGLCDQPD